MLRFDDAKQVVDIGVHDLIDAGPREGHLQLQVAWSARTRMKAGQDIHTAYQAERAGSDEEFQREVTLRRRLVVRDWECRVQGRVDGLTREGERTIVEEIKSTMLPADLLMERTLADFPDWTRQLQLYLWMLEGEGHKPLGRLILISVLDGSRRILPVSPDPAIHTYITTQLDWIVHQHEDQRAWRARRRAAPVPFPHDHFRPGQETLVEDIQNALRGGRQLLLQAPTGYGKTAAALYAALVVARDAGLRVFFATARTTQQRMAEDTLREMVRRGLPIRAVTLRAREKVCLNDVVVCRPDACTYAESYHDKVRELDLVRTLWSLGGGPQLPGVPPPDRVVEIAGSMRACPFALSLDLVASADVVIGDYNYAFDPNVRLAEIADRPHEWLIVVDEAHNLPERTLNSASPLLQLSMAEGAAEALRDGPHRAHFRPYAEVMEDVAEWLWSGIRQVPSGAKDREIAVSLNEGVDRRSLDELGSRIEALALEYTLLKHRHSPFPSGAPDLWLDVGRAVLRARAMTKAAGKETMAIWKAPYRRKPRPKPTKNQGSLFRKQAITADLGDTSGLKLLHRDSAAILGPLFQGLAGVVCMSATLAPPTFYQHVLGLSPDKVSHREHPSPFPPENRAVLVCDSVSTEYRFRERDIDETARLVSEALRAIPGNAAVFLPSFAYLEDIAARLDFGDRPVLKQERRLTEDERSGFLATLKEGKGHVLLAVLGGIFSEGVDLPGNALLGAIIVGPALPQANLERRLIQEWYQEKHGEGFLYAWLVPGMSRVVQAAGRIIRTEDDVGAIVLICRRFRRAEYAALLPTDWAPRPTRQPFDDLHQHWNNIETAGDPTEP